MKATGIVRRIEEYGITTQKLSKPAYIKGFRVLSPIEQESWRNVIERKLFLK